MESLDSTYQHFLKPFKKYCVSCKEYSIDLKKWLYYTIQVLILLQTLSLVIPPDGSNSPPWNYQDLIPIWKALAVISRWDYIIRILNLPAACVFLHLCCYHFLLMIHCYKFITIYFHSKLNKGSIQEKIIKKVFLYKFEGFLRFFLMNLSLIPALLSMANLIDVLRNYEVSINLSYFLIALNAIPILVIFLIDSLYLQGTDWIKKPYSLISIPRYVLLKRCAILSLVICSKVVSYSDHPEVRSILQIIIGGYILYVYIWIQPYAKLGCNVIEATQGLIFASSGIIFLTLELSAIASQTHYTTELIFFLTLPLLAYSIKYLARWQRLQIQHSGYKGLSINHMFKMIYKLQHANPHQDESKYVQNEDIKHYIETLNQFHSKNGWVYIWIIYYFFIKKNWIGAHIMLSNSNKATNYTECCVYISECKKTLQNELKALNGTEWEGYNYINFRENLTLLVAQDKICCNLGLRVYQEMLSSISRSSLMSQNTLKLLKQINKTRQMYDYMLDNYESNYELMLLYAGFLKAFLGIQASKEICVKAQRQLDEEMKKSELKESEVNFFHGNNMKIAISLEPENVGEIVWVYNSHILGYEDSSIVKETFVLLVPSPIKEIHDCLIKHSTSLFRPHSIFSITHDLYMTHRNGYLIPIYLKERMTNTSSNKIIMISGVKIHYEGKEIAMLYEDGSIASMTEFMSSVLSNFLEIPKLKVWGFNILNEFLVGDFEDNLKIGEVQYDGFGILAIYTYTLMVMKKVPVKSLILIRKSYPNSITPIKLKNVISEKKRRVTCQVKLNQIKFNIVNKIFKFGMTNPPQVEYHEPIYTYNQNSKDNSTLNLSTGNKSLITSTKNINTEEKKTINSENHYNQFLETTTQMKKLVNIAIRKMRITLFLEILICIIGCTVFCTYIRELTDYYQNNTSDMILIGDLRDLMIKITILSKHIYEIDCGFLRSQSRESLLTELGELSTNLQSINYSIIKENFNYELHNFIIDSEVEWNYYRDEQFQLKRINLIDASNHIIDMVSKLQISDSFRNSDNFIELYRNIPAEFHQNFNNTLYTYSKNIISLESVELYYTLSIFDVCFLLAFTSFTIVQVWVLLQLNRIRKRIWSMILNTSRSGIHQAMKRMQDRLLDSHKETQEILIDVYSQANTHKSAYSQHKYQKLLYMTIGLIFPAYMISIIYPSFISATNLQGILSKESTILYTNTHQKTLVLMLYLYTRENAVLPIYFPSNQYLRNYTSESYEHIDKLHTSISKFIDPTDYSDDINTIYFGRTSNNELSWGLKPAVREYTSSIRNILQKRYQTDSDILLDLENLDRMKDLLDSGYTALQQMLLNHLESEAQDELDSLSHFFILYFVFVIFTLLCVAFTIISKIKKQLRDEIHILLYMPREETSFSS